MTFLTNNNMGYGAAFIPRMKFYYITEPEKNYTNIIKREANTCIYGINPRSPQNSLFTTAKFLSFFLLYDKINLSGYGNSSFYWIKDQFGLITRVPNFQTFVIFSKFVQAGEQ